MITHVRLSLYHYYEAIIISAISFFREDGETDFLDDYSEVLLLNVVNTAAKACQDSDKVKANGVRSLGNVLRYIPAKSVGKLVVK